MLARGVDEPDDVLRDRLVDVDLLDRGLHLLQLVEVEHLVTSSRGWRRFCSSRMTISSIAFVAEAEAEHEPIELRLRQRESALVLDRVLRRDDEERRRHRIRDAVDRRLALLHALEQRGLRLRRRAVDLVGETTWAMIGPGRNSNSAVFWLKIERPVTSDGSRSGVNWMRGRCIRCSG